MKNIKRLAAITLTLVILVLSIPVMSVAAADADMRYGRTKLDANSQKVYDRLVTGCANNTPTEIPIDPSWNITVDQLHKAFKMFYSDYPEYFWVTNGLYGWSALGTTVVSFKPNYCISNVANAKSAYNSKVDELTSGLSGKSDYEKAKIIHDRLIDTVTYTPTENDQTSYGALVEGKAVCNGYAKAYQHLLLKVGIPAWYVSGSSINPNTNTPEPHAWNLVKLDGKWYYTDVTWDDQGENTFYEYLNITTAKMAQGHTLNDEYAKLVPQATSTDANFYKKEGREFSGYDQAKLVELLKKDNNKTQIYINGDVNSFLRSVESNLLSIGNQLGGKGAFTVSYSASTLQNALILNVVVVSENHTHKTKTTVKQVNATCLSNGTKAYYVCDCGLKFSDSACTKQISSDSELDIPALSHTPSEWKNDAANHWKECTKCGSETANTRGSHADGNKDYKCDTCGYALPKADESGNIIVDSGTSGDTTPSGSGNSTGNDSGSDSQTSSPDDATQPSDEPDASQPNENPDETPNDDGQETVGAADEDNETEFSEDDSKGGKSKNNTLTFVLIGVGILVAAGIAVTIILVIKKK